MKAGIAKKIITPPVGVDLSGYVGRSGPSVKVHDDVYARALVLDDGATRIGIVSLDMLGTDMSQDAALREGISKATGIPRRNLLIGSSHTHSGPAFLYLRECGTPDPSVVSKIVSQVVEAAVEANGNLADARLSFTKTESDLGWNRRQWVVQAKVQQSPTSGVITDHTLSGLRIEIDGRQPIVLFNYACHGVIMGPDNLELSADWIGVARKIIESSGAADTAMFLQGCCGNTNPRYRGTFELREQAGEAVAKPLLTALADARPVENPKIRVAWRDIELPYIPLPPADELEKEVSFRKSELAKLQAESAPDVRMQTPRAMLGWAQDALKTVTEGEPKSIKVGLQAIAIGNIVFAALPAEAFCEYGLAFRKMSAATVIPVGYANGNIGYLPTAEAYKEGGYEPTDAVKYYGIQMISPESEMLILNTMKDLLTEVA